MQYFRRFEMECQEKNAGQKGALAETLFSTVYLRFATSRFGRVMVPRREPDFSKWHIDS
jgi:hypothetical protein